MPIAAHPEDYLFRVSLYHSDDAFDCTHTFIFETEASADEFIKEYSERARKHYSKKVAGEYISNVIKNSIAPTNSADLIPETLWDSIFSDSKSSNR
jgi:hypothetical protein